MVSFTRTLALELADHRIRVNAIAPDHTFTPGNQGNRAGPVDPSTSARRTEAEEEAWTRLIPLGREGVDLVCGDAGLFCVQRWRAMSPAQCCRWTAAPGRPAAGFATLKAAGR